MLDNKSVQCILGFDFGLKRIGIAVGQKFTKTASPLSTLNANNGVPNWSEIQKMIVAWKPDALLVGLPLNMDDSISDMAKRAEAFACLLEEKFALMVVRMDERLSTREAKHEFMRIRGKAIKRGQRVDAYAAVLLIESWFNNFT